MPLPENEAGEITFQIGEGLQHLHENRFVHRDLKPESEQVLGGLSKLETSASVNVSRKIAVFDQRGGTPVFLAPEMQALFPPELEASSIYNYSEKVDIWSLGMTVFYILFHLFPFTSNYPHALPIYVRGGSFPFPNSPILQKLSEECLNFMKAAIAPNASVRLSAQGVLESSWLKQRPLDLVPQMEELHMDIQRASEIPPQKARSEVANLIESQETITPTKYRNTVGKVPAMQFDKVSSSSKSMGLLQDNSDSHWKRLEATIVLQKQSEERMGVLRPKHEDTLTSLHALGTTMFEQSEYSEAEAAYRKAYKGRIGALGANHTDTLLSLHCLGNTLYNQNKYTEAGIVYRKAYEGRIRTLGTNHTDTLCSLHFLGNSFYYQGKYTEAETVYRQAYKGRIEALGANHTDTFLSLHCLGKCLSR
ncbi:kinase-like protein [Penicillium fimorum]|uniref:Kinase-like protein n=1 Tax=Penicillium fimorum TaxID=1882269 RepID=A0A9X0C7X6_9EURO|nr:kinase-like protein [Penicillium fimorum]